MGFLGNFLKGDNDEVLFFILVFLFLFNGNVFGKSIEGENELTGNSGLVLFFIILFLLLFFNNNAIDEPQ